MLKPKCPSCSSTQLVRVTVYPQGYITFGIMQWVEEKFFGISLKPRQVIKPETYKSSPVESFVCSQCGFLSTFISNFEVNKAILGDYYSKQQEIPAPKSNKLIC